MRAEGCETREADTRNVQQAGPHHSRWRRPWWCQFPETLPQPAKACRVGLKKE